MCSIFSDFLGLTAGCSICFYGFLFVFLCPNSSCLSGLQVSERSSINFHLHYISSFLSSYYHKSNLYLLDVCISRFYCKSHKSGYFVFFLCCIARTQHNIWHIVGIRTFLSCHNSPSICCVTNLFPFYSHPYISQYVME